MYHLLVGLTLTCYVSADFNRVLISPKLAQFSFGNALKKPKSNAILTEDDVYVDKPENKMLLPVPMDVEMQAKKKLMKKHLKSPIQKIIARKTKATKMTAKRLTTRATLPPASDDLTDDFEIDEKDDTPTTQAAFKPPTRQKFKKWAKKEIKYHSQIQKMPNRLSPKFKRVKRQDRDNTIIFQDFDEFEFLDRKKDYNIVKTHYKKYW